MYKSTIDRKFEKRQSSNSKEFFLMTIYYAGILTSHQFNDTLSLKSALIYFPEYQFLMYDKKKISTEKNSSELLLIILILPGRAC
jgi:hypothetical protein